MVEFMTHEQFAAKLTDGVNYRNELSKEQIKELQTNGLVAVYGASDDLMEFEGCISNEFGKEVFFDHEGTELEPCEDGCIYSQVAFKKANKIRGNYVGGVWSYETIIPHSTFKVFDEDGDLYCNAIVFSIHDLKII